MKRKVLAALLVVAMLLPMFPAATAQAATMKKGSKGTEVKRLQMDLTLLGYSTGGVDSDFGSKTQNAVLKMQKALGFDATGTVTDAHWKMIKETVKDVQRYLKEKGYYTGSLDGISGNGTQKALKQWQKKNGYKEDGVLTVAMMKKMLTDTGTKVKMDALKEWVDRYEGTYNEKTPTPTPTKVVAKKPGPKEYEEHVQERLDELLSVLEGKYFTVTREACYDYREVGNHSCENCVNVSIMTRTWFKDIFGEVHFTNLPKQHYNSETSSNVGGADLGFTMFAQWFVYAFSNDEKIECKKEKSGTFTKAFLEKEVEPGDVLRIGDTHSVIVYKVTKDNIVVVDCNGKDNDLNCVVRKRTLLYDGMYKDMTVHVERVKKPDNTKESKQFYHLMKAGLITPTPTPTATPLPWCKPI